MFENIGMFSLVCFDLASFRVFYSQQTTRNNDIWSAAGGRSANNISPHPSVKYTQFDIFKLLFFHLKKNFLEWNEV